MSTPHEQPQQQPYGAQPGPRTQQLTPQQQAPQQQAPQTAQLRVQQAPQQQAPQQPQQQVPQQQAPQQAAGPQAGGYHSPVPTTRANLGHAIVSEWTKIRSVRSTMWTLGVMVVLLLGLDLLVVAQMATVGKVPESQMFTPALMGLLPGSICVITLGALVITSEYGTGMIRATMTACPARGRVLAAKSLVFFLLAFVVTTVTCTLAALLNSVILDNTTDIGGMGVENSDWLNATIGEGLFVGLLGLLTLGVGTLLRHSAGTITTMLGAVLLPMVAGPILIQIPSLKTAGEKLLEYSPLSGIGSFVGQPFSSEEIEAWNVFGGYAIVTAVVLAGAYALLRTRDV